MTKRVELLHEKVISTTMVPFAPFAIRLGVIPLPLIKEDDHSTDLESDVDGGDGRQNKLPPSLGSLDRRYSLSMAGFAVLLFVVWTFLFRGAPRPPQRQSVRSGRVADLD